MRCRRAVVDTFVYVKNRAVRIKQIVVLLCGLRGEQDGEGTTTTTTTASPCEMISIEIVLD